MSAVTDIYDAIVTKITSAVSDYKRIPNPYDVEANTFLHLRNGFGIEIGPGFNTERFVSCISTWQRTYNIILVKQVLTTQNNTPIRVAIEKDILDDQNTLFKAFEIDPTLGGKVIKTVVQSDSGIAFLAFDNAKFLSMQILIDVEYQENPST